MEINLNKAIEDARDAGDMAGLALTRSDLQVVLSASANEIARQAIVEQFKAIIRVTKNVLSGTDDPTLILVTKFHLNLMEKYLEEVEKNGPTLA